MSDPLRYGLWGRTRGMQHALPAWPLALLVVLLLHAFAVATIGRLRVDNGAEAYQRPGTAALRIDDALRADFPGTEHLTMLFRGDDLYDADFLNRLDRLVERLGQHALVARVRAVTNLERIAGTGDGFAVERLVDMRQPQPGGPAALRARVLGDRFAPGVLAARDGRQLAVRIWPLPLASSGERLQFKLAVVQAVNEAGLQPLAAGGVGPVSFEVAELSAIVDDARRLLPLAAIAGLVLVAALVGRWRPVLFAALAVSTVVATTLGALAASGLPYALVTTVLPVLLAAATLAMLLHLYAAVQAAQRVVSGRAASVDLALRNTRPPALAGAIGTAACLLTLVAVPLPPVQGFGLFGAGGIALAFLTVYGLVPPLLLRLDRQPWTRRRSAFGRLGRLARQLAVGGMRHPRWWLVGSTVVLPLLATLLPRIEAETDRLAVFAADHPTRVESQALGPALAGTSTLEISLQGAGRDTFQQVGTLQWLQALQDWLDRLPEVDRSISMVDLVEEMNRALHGEQAAERRLPEDAPTLQQILLAYDGHQLYDLVNRDFQHARLVVTLNETGTRAIRETIERIEARLEQMPLAGVQAEVGGSARLLADPVAPLTGGLARGLLAAVAALLVMLTLIWRSFAAAALCLTPGIAALGVVGALMGACGIALDPTTAVAAAIVFGLTTNGSIHLVDGQRLRRRHGRSVPWAIVRSFDIAGRAVLAAAAAATALFVLLTASELVPPARLGLLATAGLLAGLACQMLLLPALLALRPRRLVRSRRSHRRRGRPRRRLQTADPALAVGASGDPGSAFDAVTVPLALTPSPSPPPPPPPPPTPPPASALPDPAAHAGARVLVCTGTRCRAAGAGVLLRHLVGERETLDAGGHAGLLRVTRASCLGPCQHAPVVQVYPEGSYYGAVDRQRLQRILSEHVIGGRAVDALALSPAQIAAGPGERDDDGFVY